MENAIIDLPFLINLDQAYTSVRQLDSPDLVAAAMWYIAAESLENHDLYRKEKLVRAVADGNVDSA